MADTIVIGVGELAASRTPGTVLKTFALGSCVAVVLLDPRTRSVGMVHVALPSSDISPERVQDRPGYFADTGIPALVQAMRGVGAAGLPAGLIVKLAGGANVLDPNNTFNIGKRNILAVKKILWGFGMGPRAEDVGGHISRTVSVAVDTGAVILSSHAKGEWRL
ncbi:MAG: chemotaxis protein CheD [Thermodesulfobacteriota bacterium]